MGISHLAIIPDGNRRCARKLLKTPWKGHSWGMQKLRDVFGWCKELRIKVITFYTLSLENLNTRPKRELNFLFRLAKKEIRDILENRDSFIHKNKVRVKCFGAVELLPNDLQEGLKKLVRATKNYSSFFLNLAIAYGGRQEIITACRKIGSLVSRGKLAPKEINEGVLRHNLQTNGFPDPDLVIRTGGEERLSNFLLFQTAYSELAFTRTYWPELKKEEFFSLVRNFSARERRFGS